MKISLKDARWGIRNSRTRIPFRYGSASLTVCPQVALQVTLETPRGVAKGYAGDCLPPRWFDKSPEKDFRQQLQEMFTSFGWAEASIRDVFGKPAPFFAGWRQTHEQVQRQTAARGWPPLIGSFAVSLWERAILDAAARSYRVSFAAAIRDNLYGVDAGQIHSELEGLRPADWLPSPSRSIYVRHTIGLGDPLRASDIPESERLDDGLPQSLDDYVRRDGIRYFKIKVSNQQELDLQRLRTIAEVVEPRLGGDYHCTLDGNEQYGNAEDFDRLVRAIESDSRLAQLWRNTLAVEQPLERSIALCGEHTEGIRELCRRKPVIIDESDGDLDAYRRALELGYRGVSSKACKGALKSLLNYGLTWRRNEQRHTGPFIMTGEDLCTVGMIPVQADLCLVATLGLTHVERNGHHYHAGLSYLDAEEAAAVWQAHPELYGRDDRRGGRVGLRIQSGQLDLARLVDCPGMGFAIAPQLDRWTPLDEWDYDSLAG